MPMKGAFLHLLGIMVLVRDGLLLLHRDDLDCELPNVLADWEVIELTEDEAKAYATVGVSLDDSRYIMPSGLGRIADELSRGGVEPIESTTTMSVSGAVACPVLPMLCPATLEDCQ
ncbi:MAG: hypothetical protein CM1200mP18_00360 [Gammaproteobacteria bacterium]|nr:MAG: hypothetical protein CM1200mP18_00360 [Gammaproteobacteria bacterium]